MSAFVVDREHIRYLVNAGLSGRLTSGHGCRMSWTWDVDRDAGSYQRGELRSDNAAEVGAMLWAENVASVRYRYPGDDSLPGPIGETFDYHEHRHDTAGINPVEVLKACDCYEYQSCEHPGWNKSEARAYIDSLRCRAYRALPGYDAAPWGAPKPNYPATGEEKVVLLTDLMRR